MAADSSVEASALQLNLTHDEKQFFGQLFRQADTGGAGVVTGDVAVTFFEKTRLDSRVLGEIWQIADKENRGFLTPAGFSIVLRLIGHAQAGREPTPTLALEPGQLPRFDGIGPPTVGSPPPPAAIQPQGSGGVRIPPLTPEKVAQYSGLFERQPLQGGTLPGDQAKQIFEKSGLPNEILGRIWMLADTEQRGALVQAEFIIAMHLLTSMKTGSLRALPTVLPAALYEAATRRGSPVAPRQSPQSTGVPASVIPRQLSGTQARVGSPLGRPPIGPQGTGSNWAVTPADKVKFDHIFVDLDKTNKGFITGEEAVPFLKQSGLPEDALAQIWDLSDINSHGQLTRDEFAVAMFLIRQQRGNRSAPLPATLPPNLIPPSLRNRPPVQAQSAFQAPTPPLPPPAPKSALDDLFGLESSPSPAPDLSAAGSTASDPFAGGVPSSPTSKAVSSGVSFKPFVPSSSFGRGLAKQPTGDSTPSSSQQATQFGDDLLGDTDPDISKKLTGETTELANLSNQIGSLSKQMQDTQAKRTNTQNELNQANSQKQNFEQRLSQLRTLYEKEAQDTRALEEQLRTARADTQKLQSECMILEGTYKDVQTQHQETLSSLQADQQENANLRERIRVVNGEIAQLKPQIEKLKSDARQQKGLVAINKKQLSTTENERDKLKAEAEELTKSNEELSRQINTGSPASTTAKVASPALSTASGNNPFFNRTASTDIMGAFAPPSRTFSDTAFDDVFGPSAPVGSSATPPPPTSFKRQHTGNSAVSFSSAPNGSPTMSRQATLAEPPAPPESRQITSSNLPLPQHSESLTSSRQVSPPASRAEGSLNEISFPTDSASSAALPGAFPADDSDKADIPGGPPPATSEEAGNKASDEPSEAPKSSDVFANTDQAKAKEEFDNAFAAFASTKSTSPDTAAAFEPPKNKSVFNTEFPPISSLEKDDDSDSESDEGGFEDDFAPRSPPQKLKAADASSAPATEGIKGDSAVSATGQANETHEQPSSPTTPTAPAATGTAQQQSSIDDIFGKADPAPTAAAKQPAPSNPSGKGAFDESEDDFEGLEEAKEGSGYEDFADVSRSGLEDFNPVFDSSPPGSQAKSESFGNGSSFDFISTSSAPGVTAPTAAPSATAQQKTADSHDWDAIFAGLDSEPAAAPAANDLLSDKADGLAIPERPAVGRALTEGGEHDDPIVKDLVGMGYARKDAVNALEKYNYNLEKAANHLASQS